MADEAFALSPISARSASPTDADYDAIREAFMETARGRWFLGEYAKRNRNADTAMVLEAVARLEQSVAASRAQAKAVELPPASISPSAPSSPASDEILVSIKTILERTRAAITAALEKADLAGALEPFQSSARIIREIAWGLRESGADGRICNILDTQVRAIAAACESLAGTGHLDAVLHTFDASLAQIEELSQGETVLTVETASSAEAPIPDAIIPDTVTTDMDASIIDVPVATMAAATISETNQDAVIEDAATAEPSPVAIAGDFVMENRATATPSLGDSLIARGIVAPSSHAPSDPLAPIRRMSQAEKIAFFS